MNRPDSRGKKAKQNGQHSETVVRDNRRPPWGLSDILIMTVFYFGTNLLLATIFRSIGLFDSNASRLSSSLVATIIADIATVGLIVWLVRRSGGNLASLGFRLIPNHLLYVPGLGFLVALAILILYAAVVSALGLEDLVPQNNMPPGVLESTTATVLYGFLALAVAPIAEEVIIRGFLFGGLRRWFPIWAAAVISGILFGLLHMELSVIVPISIIGVLFAVIYGITGSIYASMLTHFIFNMVSFFATLLGEFR